MVSLSAYVLAGDPWWLEASVRSYYHLVDRIVVSYDQDHLSWTGTPLPVPECLDLIAALDVDDKCVYQPGHYARLDHHPLDNDTFQRQCALDAAGEDADWVIQLDTDEVLQRPDVFAGCVRDADEHAADGVEFPARWLYNTAGPSRFTRFVGRPDRPWFLERCRRFWGISATFPGPVAVRPGTQLTVARQGAAELFRVDYRAHNTDTHHPADAPVHRVIGADEGILHFSWVRDAAYMARKTGWSGHTTEYAEPRRIRNWRLRAKAPLATEAAVLWANRDERYRLVQLEVDAYVGARERVLLNGSTLS
ncbi:MAG: hypothetical protein ACR2LI_05535 [Propionibacteriaceae bacterium]